MSETARSTIIIVEVDIGKHSPGAKPQRYVGELDCVHVLPLDSACATASSSSIIQTW